MIYTRCEIVHFIHVANNTLFIGFSRFSHCLVNIKLGWKNMQNTYAPRYVAYLGIQELQPSTNLIGKAETKSIGPLLFRISRLIMWWKILCNPLAVSKPTVDLGVGEKQGEFLMPKYQ